MNQIASALEQSGHTTFLPQRDGIELSKLHYELSKGSPPPDASLKLFSIGIFAFDAFQLLESSDAVVANLNGRVPDEGTIVEAALAWYAGKPVVLYKNDDRSFIAGGDNPMLLGLGSFRLTTKIKAIPEALSCALRCGKPPAHERVLDVGRSIAKLRNDSPSHDVWIQEVAKLITGRMTDEYL